MILERLEPKKSTEVAVGAPGRPCKVAKGGFLAPGFNIFPGGQVTSAKNKCVSHRKYGNDVANSRELPLFRASVGSHYFGRPQTFLEVQGLEDGNALAVTRGNPYSW